jgi:hypothetical protein
VRIPNGLRTVYGLWVGATLCIRRLNACRKLLQPTFRRSGRAVSALSSRPASGLRPLARSPNHFGGAGFELMSISIVGKCGSTISVLSGETGGRGEVAEFGGDGRARACPRETAAS